MEKIQLRENLFRKMTAAKNEPGPDWPINTLASAAWIAKPIHGPFASN